MKKPKKFDKNVDWEWFREKREAIHPDFSQNRMAEMMGIDKAALSNITGRNAKRFATMDEAIDMAIILRVPLFEVMRHLGYNLRGVATKRQAEGMKGAARRRLIEKRVDDRKDDK